MLREIDDAIGKVYRYFIPIPERRPMIEYIRDNNGGYMLTGVEIGVRNGNNAQNILSLLPIKKLYLVDPYVEYDDVAHFSEKTQREYYDFAKRRLNKFNNKTFVIKTSEDAAREVPDNLDFVYIDGNHTYDFVKQDIELWYPKIVSGGVFGGHDATNMGVMRAVVEFIGKTGLKFYSKAGVDWWVIKPEDETKPNRYFEDI